MTMQATPWSLKTVRDRCTVEDGADDADATTGCWLWKHCTTGRGRYPQASIEGHGGTLVARWVMQHLGHAVAGMAVRPACGAQLCVKPGHLKLATKGAVLRRAYATGARSGDNEHLNRRRRAEKTGMARINMAQARVLRSRMQAGETIAALSVETGLWPSTLSSIKHHRSWREVHAAASVFSYRPQP